MAAKSVNAVLADNLRYWMGQSGISSQEQLAAKSGVSQRTISNYLNPENRQESATGKEPSAKLTELDKIAGALGVGVWDLVRPMTPRERQFYRQVEQAYRDLMNERAPNGSTNA
jgi:transcriptional regulator with XRE-family HTH domain